MPRHLLSTLFLVAIPLTACTTNISIPAGDTCKPEDSCDAGRSPWDPKKEVGGSGPTSEGMGGMEPVGGMGTGGSDPTGSGGGEGGYAPKPEPPQEGACAACYQALCKPTQVDGCACASDLCQIHCEDYLVNTCNTLHAGGSGGSVGSGGTGGHGAEWTGGGASPEGGNGNGADLPEEDCTNGKDDNGNSLTDCDDSVCAQRCEDMCSAPPLLVSGVEQDGLLQGHTTLFQANCVPVSDLGFSVAYKYQAPASGWLTLELASEGDLALSAHKGQCLPQGYSYCKNTVGAGGTETLVVPVVQGETWYTVVTTTNKNPSKEFKIRATFEPEVCGDGKVSPGEECDDGNALDGDDCSADCKNDSCNNAPALEDKLITGKEQAPSPSIVNGELQGGPSLLQASCSKLGVTTGEKIHAFRAANPGRLEVSVVPQTPGMDLILSVRSSCAPQGELNCTDATQAGGAERLSLPAEAGQPFYFVVEGADPSMQGAYELRAQTLPVACGDGLLVKSVEQCDPNAGEKQCSASCTRLADDGDAKGSAVTKFPASGVALGRIFPGGDADQFSVEVPPKGLRLTVTDPTDNKDCANQRIDSQLEVFDTEGLLVAFNDDPSPGATAEGYCSEVILSKPGIYTVRVRSSQRSAPIQVFSYRLVASPL